MNVMHSFNRTIDYIERTLPGKADEKTVARLSGCSYSMFSRVFSILTGMTLSEYVRMRVLTEAAVRLRDTEDKVIDIALDCGYESPDSFGSAFKSFHGCTPTDVRRGKPFKVASRIQLTLKIQGGRSMKVSIQKKPAFLVAGTDARGIPSSECGSVWDRLFSLCGHERLSSMGSGQSFGVCHDIESSDLINYMAGYQIKDAAEAEKAGLSVLSVDEAEYAVVELEGSVPDCIHAGWRYVMEVFFPEHGYVHSGKPDFEVYGEGDMKSPDYRMQLWIPVTKA